MMTSDQLIKLIRRHQPAQLALLLGAGASKSSGVPLASEMRDEWRQDVFESAVPAAQREGQKATDWLATQREKYPWFESDAEYSLLFEHRYRQPVQRRMYVEEKIEGVRPGWGYLYLANVIVQARRFSTVFTTNFDDLLADALGTYLHHTAVVCDADSQVDLISFLSDRAKIVKLHGGYLFSNIRNTEVELAELSARMAAKFSELSRQRGLVVLGYAGRDRSVMAMIETLLADEQSFPHGVYWCLLPGEKPSDWVARLAEKYASRFELCTFEDFDDLMARLHEALGLRLPITILSPHEALQGDLSALVGKAGSREGHPLIAQHSAQLQALLGRPVEAELALSRRDYRVALTLAQQHVQQQQANAQNNAAQANPRATAAGHSVWGSALAVQAEEEARDSLFDEAATHLRRAVALDPQALPPRYELARLLGKRGLNDEAITAHRELLALTPNDRGLRRNLVNLLFTASRLTEAEQELQPLLDHDTQSAEVQAIRGALLTQRGRMPQAVAAMRDAVALAPNNPQLRVQLSQGLITLRQLDDAEDELRHAVRLAPQSLLYLIGLAEFCLGVRQNGVEAAALLEKAVQLDPQSSEALGRLGEVYMMQGRMQDAQRQTAAAAAVAGQDARILVNLGNVTLQLNQPEPAQRAFLQAREASPSMPEPRYWLCLMHAARGDHAAWNQEWTQLQRLLPPQRLQLLQQQSNALGMQAQQCAVQGRPFNWTVALPSIGFQPGGPGTAPGPQQGQGPMAPSGAWPGGAGPGGGPGGVHAAGGSPPGGAPNPGPFAGGSWDQNVPGGAAALRSIWDKLNGR